MKKEDFIAQKVTTVDKRQLLQLMNCKREMW